MPDENEMRPNAAHSSPRRWLANRSLLALFALGAVSLVLYGTIDRAGKKEPSGSGGRCAASQSMARLTQPFARGELAALVPTQSSTPMAQLSFAGPGGEGLSLERFAGRVVLLNLWATWCLPCRAEMPALDRLEAARGGEKFEVVAINIDTARLERREAFLKEAGVERLRFYSDKSAVVFQELKAAGKASGLPTTVLIGPDGCDIATMAGAAEWDSEEAKNLISKLLENLRNNQDLTPNGPS